MQISAYKVKADSTRDNERPCPARRSLPLQTFASCPPSPAWAAAVRATTSPSASRRAVSSTPPTPARSALPGLVMAFCRPRRSSTIAPSRSRTPSTPRATSSRRASRPLVYLAPGLTCEAQREGVALADALRAALDTITSDTAMGAILAAQERGRASATLGEARHRADVVVWWGVDPARAYPRYGERYAPLPPGLYVPGGRASRTVISVDVGNTPAPADADRRFALPGRGRDRHAHRAANAGVDGCRAPEATAALPGILSRRPSGRARVRWHRRCWRDATS